MYQPVCETVVHVSVVAEAIPAPLPQVQAGSTIELAAEQMGVEPGRAILELGELTLPITVQQWNGTSTVITMPAIGLAQARPATIHLLRADGQTISSLPIELVPAS